LWSARPAPTAHRASRFGAASERDGAAAEFELEREALPPLSRFQYLKNLGLVAPVLVIGLTAEFPVDAASLPIDPIAPEGGRPGGWSPSIAPD